MTGHQGAARNTGRVTLDELIAALEAENPDRTLPLGFTNPHSYRGFYEQLAFEPAANVTIGQMLADVRLAKGSTHQGWKGGDYTMGGWTDCHLAEEGRTGEEIGPVLLTFMLAGDQLDEAARTRLAGFEPETARWQREAAADA